MTCSRSSAAPGSPSSPTSKSTRAQGRAHALRRALGRADLRQARADARRRVPRAARLRAHDPAARGELPRQHLGAAAQQGVERGRVGRLGRRHPRRPRTPGTLAVPTRSSTTPRAGELTFFDGRDAAGHAHRFHAIPTARGCAAELLEAARAVRASRSSTAASMPRRRARGSNRPPRSTGSSATAPTWSA